MIEPALTLAGVCTTKQDKSELVDRHYMSFIQ